jgi:hypothetical protein
MSYAVIINYDKYVREIYCRYDSKLLSLRYSYISSTSADDGIGKDGN